ncbi:hypothetical protein OSC27_02790 [Microbacterium sp. STN6]|uniref:hypothetical protein n=1 Tax=Microbacterium sp. STN6 TaxID=2995588 RepID=UPI002260D8DC|nr:hypothetical protein [Microbacterium sp. STN6]MCX7521202.1 hypothetical protein [Microbacterium sp. STN6]
MTAWVKGAVALVCVAVVALVCVFAFGAAYAAATRASGASGRVVVHKVDAARHAQAAAEATASAFSPGLIVSDDSFFNARAMTAPQVQAFLASATCRPADGAPCLADYRETTHSTPEKYGHCEAYAGAANERASRIIVKVARACGISPKTLIVLVQKEQSLVTRPSMYGYQRATGYACPDSADCDATYFGLFNQLYSAAWQFREYGFSSDWRYHVGTVAIQYHPNLACGASDVRIRNQATADLYNYTPYQPNDETLKAPDGPAGSCSTYGNLNFSRIWNTWFGSPLAVRFPDWLPTCLRHPHGVSCEPVQIPATP